MLINFIFLFNFKLISSSQNPLTTGNRAYLAVEQIMVIHAQFLAKDDSFNDVEMIILLHGGSIRSATWFYAIQ